MSFRYLIETTLAATVLLAGCSKSSEDRLPEEQARSGGVIDTALTPGSGRSLVTHDPRAQAYFNNAEAVTAGKALFNHYNCSGCHSNGGGGMGPPLMDGSWIYGGRLEQIHQTLVEGRPNGMPAWGGKIPDPQLWQLAAYVRSMSLPQTLAGASGNTPSQFPAPVPKEADDDAGWAPPGDLTTDYGTTLKGPE